MLSIYILISLKLLIRAAIKDQQLNQRVLDLDMHFAYHLCIALYTLLSVARH